MPMGTLTKLGARVLGNEDLEGLDVTFNYQSGTSGTGAIASRVFRVPCEGFLGEQMSVGYTGKSAILVKAGTIPAHYLPDGLD